MSSLASSSDAPAPLAPVAAAHQRLERIVSELHARIERIAAALSPVLYPSTPAAKESASCAHPIPNVPMAADLTDMGNDIELAVAKLDTLLERIAL